MPAEIFSSRVDAAKQLGRLRCYADEKRRLLSIVAMKYFQCSSKTVTAAKVHCILFGRGGVPVEKFKFTHQCVSRQVLEELTEFLHRDDVSRASSCRSVLVDGEETAVRYWQDTVKGLINQYLLRTNAVVRCLTCGRRTRSRTLSLLRVHWISAFPGWKGSFLDTLYTSFLVCVCFKFIILQFIVNTKPALVHIYVCLYTDGQ